MEKVPTYQTKQKQDTQVINLEKGKLPPQAVDLEEVILGALLIDRKGIFEVMEILNPEVFYKQAHQHIFEAIKELYVEGSALDLLTVSEKLKSNGKLQLCGGEFYLIQLTQKVSSSAHIEYHSRIILQKYIQRQLIKSSNQIIELAYNEEKDVFDLLDQAYDSLNEVSEVSVKPQEALLGTMINSQIVKGMQIYKSEVKAGIETPIRQLTQKCGGWRDGELIIIAARPGMGKTSLAIAYGLYAAKKKIPTAFFSLEMSKEQLTNRIISMEAKIDSEKFTVHGLSEEDGRKAFETENYLKSIPFYIDDTGTVTIENFQIKAKKFAAKYGVKFIIVDYLQLMSGGGNFKGNKEQEISKISRGLKLVAKDLNIPVIALAQLSRAVETRGGSKRPMLSDLRDSGAIEQDADVVQFIYRPEYYNITEWDDEYDRAPTVDQAEYIVAKNRNGGLTRNRMRFDKKYTLFSDLDEYGDYIPPPPNYTPSADDFEPQKPNNDEEDDLPF